MLEHPLGESEGFVLLDSQVDHGRLGDLIAHFDDRVEGVHCRLRDERDLGPAHVLTELLLVELHYVGALQIDLPAVLLNIARQQAQNGFGKRALAAT